MGAILLLMTLLKRGAASQVASLFYLVPPVTAVDAFILFDERLGALAIAGGLAGQFFSQEMIVWRDLCIFPTTINQKLVKVHE